MKIFPCSTIKELDKYTIENESIDSVDLMERASLAFTDAFARMWSNKVLVKVFAGPGNNGGDALAVARLLSGRGYGVEVFLFNPKDELSEDCRFNKELLMELPHIKFTEVSTQFAPPALTADDVIIDGLFGSGINKPLSGGFASVVKYINSSPSTVVSIDMPSGLMGEDNAYNIMAHVVRADYTFTFQNFKLAFLFAENADIVGEVKVLDIGLSKEGMEKYPSDYELLEEGQICSLIKPRKRFSHKGTFGHGLLIAGSYGMAGASVLAARSCLRSGVGLLTARIPSRNNFILQTAVPEAIITHDIHENYFAVPVDTDDYDAVGIGPGLGRSEETESAVIDQIKSCRIPMVIDADALNILAEKKKELVHIPSGSVLTPHPKEFERLAGKCRDSFERLAKAKELAASLKCYIVLKGAYTAVVTPEKRCYFNPTGNPGMATAGSGDVLTGVILALLSQGYKGEKAAKIGVYVHGLAGDLAAKELSETALVADDIIAFLPAAWKQLTTSSQDYEVK